MMLRLDCALSGHEWIFIDRDEDFSKYRCERCGITRFVCVECGAEHLLR